MSADAARQETLRWLHKRAGPLPSHAWHGATFEREVAPGHSAFAVSLTEPAPYWVARLDHPDAVVAGRTWSTEVTVGISPQGAQFGVRLSYVSHREDPDVELSTPGIALQVADRPGLQDFGVPLTSQPWMLETTEGVHRLLELIENHGRTRPVYVVFPTRREKPIRRAHSSSADRWPGDASGSRTLSSSPLHFHSN